MERPPQNSENLTGLQVKLLQDLFEIGAIDLGQFRLKHHDRSPEATLSPIYIELGLVQRFPKIKQLVVEAYKELVGSLKFDLLAAVPHKITPLVSVLADVLEVGMVVPRPDRKTHGSGRRIDGFLPQDKGKTFLLIDDVITQGDSKITAINLLWEEGAKITDIAVFVDRQQGGEVELLRRGIRLRSVFTLSQMIDYYARIGKINSETHKKVQGMIQNSKI